MSPALAWLDLVTLLLIPALVIGLPRYLAYRRRTAMAQMRRSARARDRAERARKASERRRRAEERVMRKWRETHGMPPLDDYLGGSYTTSIISDRWRH